MIKFAVSRPQQRLEGIEGGLKLLNWSGDKYLQNYGLEINPNMIKTKAKLLKNPVLQFGNGTEDPRISGRWQLTGKKFAGIGRELQSWGVCVMNNIPG